MAFGLIAGGLALLGGGAVLGAVGTHMLEKGVNETFDKDDVDEDDIEEEDVEDE